MQIKLFCKKHPYCLPLNLHMVNVYSIIILKKYVQVYLKLKQHIVNCTHKKGAGLFVGAQTIIIA